MTPADIESLVKRYPSARIVDAKTGKEQDKWRTPIARVAFADLVEAGKKGKFGCALLFPVDAQLQAMSDAGKAARMAKFGNEVPKGFRSPWRKQDENVGKYDGFIAGAFYINVTSTFKPPLVDARGQPLTVNDENIYSGAWVRATVTCYAYDTDGNKGVAFGLNSLQLIAHDERFGGFDPASHFDVIDGVEGLAVGGASAAPAANAASGKPIAAPAAFDEMV
jgi:hypothetical protein